MTPHVGPNLLSLSEPRLYYIGRNVQIDQAKHHEGAFYEISANRGQVTVSDLIKALEYLPKDARLRDVFNDDDESYFTFWKDYE